MINQENSQLSLTTALQLGPVELHVQDLKKLLNFYHESMGLDIIETSQHHAVLGVNQQRLLILHDQPDLSTPNLSEAGLYHFAIVFSSQHSLAKVLYRMFQMVPDSFTGSGDHLVSEAFYFRDPEGNGIELYYDRDPNSWEWKNGQIEMATLYIDPQEYLERYLVLEETSSHVKIGHIHLKVGDVVKAKQFYVDILGFDVTAELPHALFVSIGGYHHHLGMNSWESYGASEREVSTGLKQFELQLEGVDDLERLKKRLEKYDIPFVQDTDQISFFDPWKNKIVVSSRS